MSRVERNRAAYRRAAAGGALVWLGEVVAAALGMVAIAMTTAAVSVVLFILVALAVGAYLVRANAP
jgi:hypothetical protein